MQLDNQESKNNTDIYGNLTLMFELKMFTFKFLEGVSNSPMAFLLAKKFFDFNKVKNEELEYIVDKLFEISRDCPGYSIYTRSQIKIVFETKKYYQMHPLSNFTDKVYSSFDDLLSGELVPKKNHDDLKKMFLSDFGSVFKFIIPIGTRKTFSPKRYLIYGQNTKTGQILGTEEFCD
jgi:hypothetical protein